MIGSDCCFGPESPDCWQICCFRKKIQCLCLHVHSVLLRSWFGFSVFIAIHRFAAGIQINPGRPEDWAMLCTRYYPQSTTVTCAWLVLGCTPGVSTPRAIWRVRGPVTNTRAPCSWRRGWRLVIILQHGADMRDPKSLQLSWRSGCIMLGK